MNTLSYGNWEREIEVGEEYYFGEICDSSSDSAQDEIEVIEEGEEGSWYVWDQETHENRLVKFILVSKEKKETLDGYSYHFLSSKIKITDIEE